MTYLITVGLAERSAPSRQERLYPKTESVFLDASP
jgi:hypothetical protein